MYEKIQNCKNSTKLFNTGKNGRKINYYLLQKVKFVADKLHYPDIIVNATAENKLYNPIQEKTMSLKDLPCFNNSQKVKVANKVGKTENAPVFYFIYNTENYYHFLYDTLPYLITFFKLLNEIPDLKLLMNYPNDDKKDFFPFVLETLQILGIDERVIVLEENTIYESMYISDSYTHGHNSNLPPREEVYEFFQFLKNKVLQKETKASYPKNIYISRRTWTHNNLVNIGTNYTSRRVMKNECQLVNELGKKGFVEVFTENMTMTEKINLFHNAEKVVGIIGGGIANALFLRNKAELFAIISPGFLDINSRFLFSLNRQKLNLIKDTEHFEKSKFKKYMRVSYDGGYGEIYDIEGDYLRINQAKKKVSGWASYVGYEKIKIHKNKCHKLDHGLNSAFVLDIDATMGKI